MKHALNIFTGMCLSSALAIAQVQMGWLSASWGLVLFFGAIVVLGMIISARIRET